MFPTPAPRAGAVPPSRAAPKGVTVGVPARHRGARCKTTPGETEGTQLATRTLNPGQSPPAPAARRPRSLCGSPAPAGPGCGPGCGRGAARRGPAGAGARRAERGPSARHGAARQGRCGRHPAPQPAGQRAEVTGVPGGRPPCPAGRPGPWGCRGGSRGAWRLPCLGQRGGGILAPFHLVSLPLGGRTKPLLPPGQPSPGQPPPRGSGSATRYVRQPGRLLPRSSAPPLQKTGLDLPVTPALYGHFWWVFPQERGRGPQSGLAVPSPGSRFKKLSISQRLPVLKHQDDASSKVSAVQPFHPGVPSELVGETSGWLLV